MGRRPKPTNLKVLAGNPGKRKLNKLEPSFVKEEQNNIPEELLNKENSIALKEWKRIAPELLEANVLTKIDRTAIVAYCMCYQRWIQAEEAIKIDGLVSYSEKSRTIYQSPYVSISNQALIQMRAFMAEFGMTPATRGKIQAPRNTEENPLAEFLKRANERHK